MTPYPEEDRRAARRRRPWSIIWWTIFAMSIALNVADWVYDGLPVALMILGACMR